MTALSQFKEEIRSFLAQADSLEQALVHCEFPVQNRAAPLKRPVVAVGFESIAAKGGGLDAFLGEEGTATLKGRELLLVLRLDIACPGSGGGSCCHDLFEALSDRLLFTPNDFGIKKLWCEAISFDKDSGAYRLTARAELTALLQQREEEAAFTDFVLRQAEGLS